MRADCWQGELGSAGIKSKFAVRTRALIKGYFIPVAPVVPARY